MKDAFEYISSIPKFAGKTELDNTVKLIEELGVNLDSMRFIHVAGTNGKGSVCAYISNTLVKTGHKTGLFISPHLIRMNERIRINGVDVDDETFKWAYEQVMAAKDRLIAEGGKHPAFFEFLFGMAMLIFEREAVDVVVLETGLGGRLDSTNIIKQPIMTVIASVSMDHMAILGNTIEEIAAEKAGIIKPKVPVVFYGQEKKVRQVMLDKAKEMGAPYICVTDADITDIEKVGKFIDFSLKNKYYDNVRLSVKSPAYYQTGNASLAATALAWLGKEDKSLSLEAIRDGIASTFWEGRMEEIKPEVYVDGAHNEDGIRAFLETARSMKDRHQILMFSAVSDKDYDSMIAKICQSEAFDEYVVCAVEYASRALDAQVIIDTFSKYTSCPVHLENSVLDAVTTALKLKGSEDRVFIAGSLYLVGEVKELFEKRVVS